MTRLGWDVTVVTTSEDLFWWHEKLSLPLISFPIPGPLPIHDFAAFSDASSGVGIGIVIQDHWFAWDLLQGWKTDERDIGWAECQLQTSHLLHFA